MRRNWLIIREILERIEDDSFGEMIAETNKNPEISSLDTEEEKRKKKEEKEEKREKIFGHILLLMDSDLVAGINSVKSHPSGWQINRGNIRLTMKGHDMLEALKSQTVLDKVKAKAKEMSLPITQELILSVLKKLSELP